MYSSIRKEKLYHKTGNKEKKRKGKGKLWRWKKNQFEKSSAQRG